MLNFRSFGHKVINIKAILKKIPVLIEDRDKTIREETKKLMIELYRWLGPAFKPQLSAVKPLVVSFRTVLEIIIVNIVVIHMFFYVFRFRKWKQKWKSLVQSHNSHVT